MGVANIKNSELIDMLRGTFQARNEPNFAWVNACSAILMLPGLRGFWPMSSADGLGRALDVSGNVRTLTIQGNPEYNYIGLAPYIDLDGTGDYLLRTTEVGLAITGTETFIDSTIRGLTLGGWFNGDVLGADAGLIGKYEGAGLRSYLLWYDNGNNDFRFTISVDGTATVVVDSSITPSTDTWYFVAARFDPSTELAIWVNDTKDTNVAAIPASIDANAGDFTIGTYDTTNELNGFASLCWICAAYLSDAQIFSIYQQQRLLFGI